MNRKDERNGQEPVPCEIVSIDADLRYSIETFTEFAEASKHKQKRELAAKVKLPTVKKPTAKRRDTLNDHVVTCGIAEDRSAADFAMCAFAIRNGIDKNFVWAEVADVGKFAERGQDYFDATWEKAAGVVRVEIVEKNAIAKDEETEGKKKNGKKKDPGLTKELADTIKTFAKFASDPAGNLYRFNEGAYRRRGDQFVKRWVQNLVEEMERTKEWSKSLAEAVVEYIRVGSRELWEEPAATVINVKNGLLDLSGKKPKLLEHSPEHLSTIQLPITYDPQATCPATDKFDSEVFPPDAAHLSHQVAAWLICPAIRIQKALLLLGPGGDGKSRKLKQYMAMMGATNTSAVSLHKLEKERFAPAHLYQKLANICPDLPSAHLEGTSIFKSITGGDRLHAEFKNKDPFEFDCRARLLFSANHPPRSQDASQAFFDRWLVVPFTGSFRGTAAEIPEAEMDAILTAPSELSGLLNHALKHIEQLRTTGRFTIPGSVAEAHREFYSATDPLMVWLDRYTIDSPDAVVPKSVLRAAYGAECERRGRPAPTDTAFGLAIKRARPEVETAQRTVNGRKQRCYVGLGISQGDSGESQTSQGSQGFDNCALLSQEDTIQRANSLSTGVDDVSTSSRESECENPVNPVPPVTCDHLDPATWRNHDGNVYCPGCGVLME